MRLVRSFRHMLQKIIHRPEERPEESDTVDSEVELAQQQSYPTDEDVFVVRATLLQFLPLKLVNVILHAAQYWPCISAKNATYTTVYAGHSTGNNAAAYYLITPVIPTKHSQLVVEMVKFNLKSCDQGWADDTYDNGPYSGSYTWFEAGIIRVESDDSVPHIMLTQCVDDFDANAFSDGFAKEVSNPLEQGGRWKLQYNLRASSSAREHEVVWTNSDIFDDAAYTSAKAKGARTGCGFISRLAPGDRVALVARAL
ncbi:hypothetical protein C0992_002100, partial [Termitomyces sp. T32_za158]